MGNIVAIIGRPNVGKSTLFNRLIGERKAIVDDVSGVTRDRQYGISHWNGKEFTVIDTGGFVQNTKDQFELAIRDQVRLAIAEAAAIIFVTDVTSGITGEDQEVASLLRKSKKHVCLMVNKVDNNKRLNEASEFYGLGFDPTFMVSAVSGSGTGEILDWLSEKVDGKPEIPESNIPKFAIVGQPNVGKSSFVNALLNENRNIVTNIAGTTRDSIHTHYNKFEKEFWIIDTAGIRKKAKVNEDLEYYSVVRAINSIDECDICLMLIDAKKGIEQQDLAIIRIAENKKRGLVILVNKWDTIENKDSRNQLIIEKEIREKLRPFDDVPIIFMSATEKTRIMKALEAGLQVWENRQRKIPTSQLNEIMLAEIEKQTPPSVRGKLIRIKYITQMPTNYPVFAFFCNHPKDIRESYRNFLEKRLRINFNFTGTPIGMVFKEK
jgi:GTP-binding protein